MQSAIKLSITIPENHTVRLDLPMDLPVGPAEVIVLLPEPVAPRAERRPMGIDAGKLRIPEDFDAPLPPDLQKLFDGEA